MKIDNCNALITGASAGIGLEFARQLAGRAQSLILVARREERLSELRDELTGNHPGLTVHIRKIDLANLSQVEELIAWLEREKIDVDLLINNAGLGDLGPFATSDPARNEEMMLVNMVALTSLTRRLLPQMIAKKRGARVVGLASEAKHTFVKTLGADVAIEALGLQETFENCLRSLRPGGTLSSLGVYSGKLQVPYDAFAAGIGDYKIVTTLCPGGKERMRRLMSMVQTKRFDPTPLLTHSFKLDQIIEAYDLFGSRREGVLKVAIRP